MENIFSCNFPNIGFMGCNLTDEEFTPILEEALEIEQNFDQAKSMSNSLVGHINHQYAMIKTHKHIESVVLPMIHRYQNVYQSFKIPANTSIELSGAWVNFQKKHEFNPLHNHSGDFSFVIYVKIPYTIEEEKKFTHTVPDPFQVPGSFLFHYIDALGSITPWCVPTDKTYERKMLVFPAKMMHVVHPFYSSDEYRISVSGNLEVKLKT